MEPATHDLAKLIGTLTTNIDDSALMRYILIIEATAHLFESTEEALERAIVYLKDTGSTEHATGRLLLRAAERALRVAGDVE